MAKRFKDKLTDIEIRRAQPDEHKDYKLYDGGALYLLVQPNGTKLWRWKYRFAGKEKSLAIGGYSTSGGVSLAEARDKRDAARKLLRSGVDPSEAKQQAKRAARDQRENTLEAVATDYHSGIKGQFRSSKHADDWLSSLSRHVFPILGLRPVMQITHEDLKRLLLPLRDEKPETGARVYQRLMAVFDEAVASKLITNNPAALLRRTLKRPRNSVDRQHYNALPWTWVPRCIDDIRHYERVDDRIKLSLEFTVLCAARSGETRGAAWDEVDWHARTWTIAASRMKAGKQHTVYLGPRAMEILDLATVFSDRYIFPSPSDPDKEQSDMAMPMLLRRAGYDSESTTLHGLARSCFSTWANETTQFKHGVIEASLAHASGDKVSQAYNHAQYVAERRALAEQWQEFCTTEPPKGSKIQPFRVRTPKKGAK